MVVLFIGNYQMIHALKIFLLLILFFYREPAEAAEKKTNQVSLIQACIQLASETHSIPDDIISAIYQIEKGKNGEETILPNGQTGLGIMNVNEIEVPEYADMWNMNERAAFEAIRNDPCTNIGVVAYKLRVLLNEHKSLATALRELAKFKQKSDDEYLAYIKSGLKNKTKNDQEKNTKEWMFLVYDWEALIKNPKYISTLDGCLSEIEKQYSKNTKWRYHCLDPEGGSIYSVTGKIKDKWSAGVPRSYQIGKIAPWVEWEPADMGWE